MNYDSIVLEGRFDGTNYVDFSSDVIVPITGGYGIFGNGQTDKVGNIGELRFQLKNQYNSANLLGYYSPGNVNCRSGFEPGLKIRIYFVLDGIKIYKWRGIIPTNGINPIPGKYGVRYTEVVVKSWMYRAAIHRLRSVVNTTNKTAAQGIALVLADMDEQPLAVDYRTSESTFPTVFDMMTSQTTALSEIAKLTQSELGYTYETRHGLRVEGRLTRNEEKAVLDEFPMATADMEYTWDGVDLLVDENGEELLYADSTTAIFDDSQIEMEVTRGEQFYNSVKYVVYPRRVDAAATTVLYSLASPTLIPASASGIVLSGNYKDPTGIARQVNGINMIGDTGQPPLVGGTHYKMYANSDGTGTDLTANLTVTAEFTQASFKYTITNNVATAGYITFLQVVGRGVYTDMPIEYLVEDATLISAHGDIPLTIDMKYQADPMVAARYADITLLQTKQFRYEINSVKFCANKSGDMLFAFLYLEPGDRVRIKETVTGIAADYFIQGVNFEIDKGNIVWFTWTLRAAGLDTFNFVKWTPTTTPVAGYGAWDDDVYGWDI
jgi:hypothetical protein